MNRRAFLTAGASAALTAPPAYSAPPPFAVSYRRAPAHFAFRGQLVDPSAPMETAGAPPAFPTATGPGAMFAEVTGTVLDSEQLARGVPYWMARLEAGTGIDIYGNNGIAVADIDGDGVDEIYVCQPSGLPNRLFRWRAGKLEDISAPAGVDLLDDSASALFLDLRNLGRQDLIVLRSSGPVLLLNDGRGRFTLAPEAFRFAKPPQGAFTGMAAADYDRDGKLDVYCCTYSFFRSEAQFLYPAPYFDAQNGPPNFLFRNRLNADGTGFFEDVTTAVGLQENNNRYSFAPAWCDYDGSGWPSLYVANDFGRNNLYRNHQGRFRDVAAAAGVEDLGPGMSAAWFDIDGNGRPDLYIGNMWTAAGQRLTRDPAFQHRYPGLEDAWRRHTKGNSLYRNLGGGRFADVGAQQGVEMGRWAWSCDAADLDFDGAPEIFIACGMLTGARPRDPDLMSFFWREVVARTPARAERSAAYEEGWNAINQFIREGYSWNGAERNVFYRRRRSGEGFADASRESGLDFAGDSRAFAFTDIDGDGALDIVVKNRLAPQLRLFQNRSAGGERPRIGIRLRGVESNRDGIGARVTAGGVTQWLSAGSGYLSQHTKTLYFRHGDTVEITWPSGRVQNEAGLEPYALYEVAERQGKTLLRRFPREQPALTPRAVTAADNTPRLHDTWFADPLPLPDRRPGPGLLVLTAAELERSPDLAAAYALFRRYLFEYRADLELPLAFLLNAAGEAVKIYAQPPDHDTVAADLAQTASRQPLPFPGRALSQPRRDYFKLGAALLWSGYGDYALPYLERVLLADPASTRTMVLTAQIHREAGRLADATRLLDEALRIQPELAEAWNERGGIALAMQKPAEALEYFDQALAASPDLLYALLNAAQTAVQLEQPAKAEAYYRRARAAHPGSADTANGLGLLLAKLGAARAAESEALLREAVALDPALASAWNNLAVLLLRAGRREEALVTLERGIEHSPADESLYLNLGRVWVQSGKRAKAAEVMRRLLERRPDSAIARKALADLSSP